MPTKRPANQTGPKNMHTLETEHRYRDPRKGVRIKGVRVWTPVLVGVSSNKE